MLVLRLPPELDRRLELLAKKSGRSKSSYVREAISRRLDDIEDIYLARKRLARGGTRVPLERLERRLKKSVKQ